MRQAESSHMIRNFAWASKKNSAFKVQDAYDTGMPLIVLTGYPCSGKTQRAKEIEQYLLDRLKNENKSMRIHIINDESLNISKDAYKGY